MSWSMTEILSTASPLARLVLALLVGMSVAAVAVAVEKVRRLGAAERATERLRASRAPDDATADVACPAGRLLRALDGLAAVSAADRREVHERTVRRELLTAAAELRRGLGVLATVGATAPFVGLFGTVVGIIDAFREIGAGGGGVGGVSSGLAEALVATAAGIFVAVPAVWLYNYLSQRIGRLLMATEAFGEELALAVLTRTEPGASPRPDVRAKEAEPWR